MVNDLATGPVGDILAALGIPRERSNLFAGIVRRLRSRTTPKHRIRGAYSGDVLIAARGGRLRIDQAAGAATYWSVAALWKASGLRKKVRRSCSNVPQIRLTNLTGQALGVGAGGYVFSLVAPGPSAQNGFARGVVAAVTADVILVTADVILAKCPPPRTGR